MVSLEERVQLMEDKDEIRELTAKYCYAVAAQDSDALIDMFTEDGIFDMPPDRHFEGREQLSELYTAGIAEATPKPFIQNHVISVDGDTATGNCAVEIRLVENGVAMTACGYYNDKYRRENGAWKFAHRDFNLYHWVPLSEGWGN